MIPNLVFKIEAFERDIIKLGKRCKFDLFGNKYPKISTCRDFRLKEVNTEEPGERSRVKSQNRQKEVSPTINSGGDDEENDVSDKNVNLLI